LFHACKVAVVLCVDDATTVITRVAVPVLNRSGRACPLAAAAGAARTGAAAGRARDAAVLLARAAGELGAAAALLVGVRDGVGEACALVDDELVAAAPGPACIGSQAGRGAAWRSAARWPAGECDWPDGCVRPSTSTAQPATPKDASTPDTSRPTGMRPVCQE
jgi:hypothetical protein